jgi:tRNA pseudouridine55 synthase
MLEAMNGILLIDKPEGWTSFDVVNKVRRLVQHSELNMTGIKRFPVGHTGTLDPMATGLLMLLLGTYTKRAMELTKLDKVYDVTMLLGKTSSTGDKEGDKIFVSDGEPTQAAVQKALQSFIGDSLQTPPAYSAIKVNGQRAYTLARAGKEVTLEARPVHIDSIELTSYAYPFVRFTTHVSSGTYIRSLVEDTGRQLGTGAYMSDLRRTKVGDFNVADAITMDALSLDAIKQHAFQLEL